MLEKYLVEHCAPTLASLKTASLFCIKTPAQENLQCQLAHWNQQLKEKGLRLLTLGTCRGRELIYIYRVSQLQEDLRRPGVDQFLTAYGYHSTDIGDAIQKLRQRLLQMDGTFPHEIGLFLGYPLGDVMGFIQNGGKNCKCVGNWKVYCDECEAVKKFARFQKCREVYTRLWQQGRTVRQLTVAA
ncbi:MAG TPA: DUF3793 family protein [Candidatus Gallacutalibacter stercoravium]|nr:DUF3793 family protein [Candidatus Gallacutalibacter stercoravium]